MFNGKLVSIVVIAIFFSSCGTTNFIFDENIPLEESATISKNQTFKVLQFNGVDVDWGKMGNIEIRIPAGETELLVSIHTINTHRGVRYSYRNPGLKIEYNFIPGKKYQLLASIEIKQEGLFGFRNREATATFQIMDLETNETHIIILDKREYE
jgi:hypothetical protein